MEFKQWTDVTKLNQATAASVHHYVILLTKTNSFKIEKDLKDFLKLTKKSTAWLVQKFRKYGIQVEYGTIFNQKDVRFLGPLATSTSNGIVRWIMQQRYTRSVLFVCPDSFAKQLPFDTISPDTLVHRISE